MTSRSRGWGAVLALPAAAQWGFLLVLQQNSTRSIWVTIQQFGDIWFCNVIRSLSIKYDSLFHNWIHQEIVQHSIEMHYFPPFLAKVSFSYKEIRKVGRKWLFNSDEWSITLFWAFIRRPNGPNSQRCWHCEFESSDDGGTSRNLLIKYGEFNSTLIFSGVPNTSTEGNEPIKLSR